MGDRLVDPRDVVAGVDQPPEELLVAASAVTHRLLEAEAGLPQDLGIDEGVVGEGPGASGAGRIPRGQVDAASFRPGRGVPGEAREGGTGDHGGAEPLPAPMELLEPGGIHRLVVVEEGDVGRPGVREGDLEGPVPGRRDARLGLERALKGEVRGGRRPVGRIIVLHEDDLDLDALWNRYLLERGEEPGDPLGAAAGDDADRDSHGVFR